MGDLIPLFPLGTPLFPGVVLPLQIFEARYRRLVRDLLQLPEGPARSFGVVAIRQGWEVERVAPAAALYDVGCTALVQGVRPQPDGGYRITAMGADRFRLLDVLVADDPPYLRARVEWLAEEEAAEEAAGDQEGLAVPRGGVADPDDDVVSGVARGSLAVLVRGVGELFGRYVAAVAGLTGEAAGVEPEARTLLAAVAGDPRALSYLVASAALLTTEDRQALLAESATRRRLRAESRLLRRELTLLETLGAVPAPLQQFAGARSVN